MLILKIKNMFGIQKPNTLYQIEIQRDRLKFGIDWLIIDEILLRIVSFLKKFRNMMKNQRSLFEIVCGMKIL
jgi:hypothetical protein